MKNIISISLVIFFAICSRSWAEKSNFIPDGKWYGNLPVRGGSFICNFTINKIFIKNNVVNIYGDHFPCVLLIKTLYKTKKAIKYL